MGLYLAELGHNSRHGALTSVGGSEFPGGIVKLRGMALLITLGTPNPQLTVHGIP